MQAVAPAGIVSDAVIDALNTAQDWVLAKITWIIPTIWIWYGWGGIAFLLLLLIGFFLPFKWVRAGLGVILALIVAYIAGGRHMGQIKDAQAKKPKPKPKAPAKKDGWLWIILACVLLYPVPGFTQTCTPVDEVAEKARNEVEVKSVHAASPGEVKAVIDIMEAAGADFDMTGIDTMLLVTAENGFGVVLLGHGGICFHTVVPPHAWSVLLRSVRGEAS